MRPIALLLALVAVAGCRETHHCAPNESFQNGECLPRGDGGRPVDSGLDGALAADAGNDAGMDAGPCARCTAREMCIADLDGGIDAGGSCVQCVNDGDCDGVTLPTPDGSVPLGMAICDRFQCVRGCRLDADCGSGHACIANRCSNYARGQGSCEPCEHEDNCGPTLDCVAMTFGPSPGVDVGRHCVINTDLATCPQGFNVPFMGRSLEPGAVDAWYCGVNQVTTTCDAVLDLTTACTANDDCGVVGLDDGVCAVMPGLTPGMHCTYTCSFSPPDNTCPSARPCGMTTNLCGGG